MKRISQIIFIFLSCSCSTKTNCPGEAADSIASNTVGNDTLILKYKGILPCADCPGIETEIVFHYHTVRYEENDVYLERNVSFHQSGSYNTLRGYKKDRNATVYVLDDDKPEHERKFLRLNDTTLLMLDGDGEIIDTSSFYKLFAIKK